MTDEPLFLRAILARPADDTIRLVYADWLDEQTDPASAAMAKFLRLTAQRPGPMRDKRLQRLAAGLEPDWLAVVSKLPVENCGGKRDAELAARYGGPVFDYVCDRRWDDLRPTDDQTVRFCEGCGENVHYCDSITVARSHARQSRCVAIDLGVIRRERDLGPELMMLGMPSPDYLREQAALRKPDRVSA